MVYTYLCTYYVHAYIHIYMKLHYFIAFSWPRACPLHHLNYFLSNVQYLWKNKYKIAFTDSIQQKSLEESCFCSFSPDFYSFKRRNMITNNHVYSPTRIPRTLRLHRNKLWAEEEEEEKSKNKENIKCSQKQTWVLFGVKTTGAVDMFIGLE